MEKVTIDKSCLEFLLEQVEIHQDAAQNTADELYNCKQMIERMLKHD